MDLLCLAATLCTTVVHSRAYCLSIPNVKPVLDLWWPAVWWLPELPGGCQAISATVCVCTRNSVAGICGVHICCMLWMLNLWHELNCGVLILW